MFYAAVPRRSQFRRGAACLRSSPLISIENSSGRIVTVPVSFADGHWNRPFSSRLVQTHKPPSHTKTLISYGRY